MPTFILTCLLQTACAMVISHVPWQRSAAAQANIAMCASDPSSLREKADQLALLAEQAALEAEALEIEAQLARPLEADADEDEPMALSSPLRWIGPYPAIALSLPSLTTPAQKARALQAAGPGVDPSLPGAGAATGVTLDFVLDTAANTNTIDAQVAGPTAQGGLELEQVGMVAGGVGAGGEIGGGATYMLGRCELADTPKAERFVFMTGLTATALPVAAPAAAGLLGVPFLNSFAGGAEFVWGTQLPTEPGTAGGATPGTLNLFGDVAGTAKLQAGLMSVSVRALPGSGLPSVMLKVNGVLIPALLDTGSPITVLNAAAAKAAAIGEAPPTPDEVSSNPFTMFGQAIKAGMAASKAETLVVGGATGPVQLLRVKEGVTLSLGDADFGGGECRPYVGDLPGLAALNGLGASAGPAVVLGTDVLRTRPRLWYTATRVYV